MKRVAIIRKCKESDKESGKPWCLYSHEGKLLGRHESKESAREQEQAIKAQGKISRKIALVARYLALFEN